MLAHGGARRRAETVAMPTILGLATKARPGQAAPKHPDPQRSHPPTHIHTPPHPLQVVGEAEKAARTVNVRTRDNEVHGMHALDDVLKVMQEEKKTRSLFSLFGGKGGKDGAAAVGAAAAPAEA